jgi:D-alanine-D-alanine ligase
MRDAMNKHIALLYGGWSNEREVSLKSGAAVERALHELGYQITKIDIKPDIGKVLTELKPDVIFNALHGRYGEDGTIQGLLELLQIPYTHSGVLASSLAMNKVRTKAMLRANNIRTPEGGVYSVAEILANPTLSMPFIVKPPADGSSVNVFLVNDANDLEILQSLEPNQLMLVEPYIAGREIQVAVLDGKALGAIEIRPVKGKFYDYEAKYTAGMAEHIMPAPIAEADYQESLRLAERVHVALGCRGLTRTDFRYDDTGIGQNMFYALEINTQPGMTELSLSPEIAAYAGISFTELVEQMVQLATTDAEAEYGKS